MTQGVPNLTVIVTQGQRSPKDWGRLLARKIISVSDDAPPPIRDQAHAFRNRIALECANYIKMALDEERAVMARRLSEGG